MHFVYLLSAILMRAHTHTPHTHTHTHSHLFAVLHTSTSLTCWSMLCPDSDDEWCHQVCTEGEVCSGLYDIHGPNDIRPLLFRCTLALPGRCLDTRYMIWEIQYVYSI